MDRRLLVMRHAKSCWQSAAASDHARPLNDRGRAAAPRVGRELQRLGWCPTAVVASDARRARETWAGCATALPPPSLVRFTPGLYLSGPAGILSELSATPDEHACLLTIGHNPSWEALVGWLCGQRDVLLKTADVAMLQAPLSGWDEGFGAPGRWRLHGILRARTLGIDDRPEVDS